MRNIFKSDMAGNIGGAVFFLGGIIWEIFAIKEYIFGGLFSILTIHIAVIGILLPLGSIYLGWRIFHYPNSEEQIDID